MMTDKDELKKAASDIADFILMTHKEHAQVYADYIRFTQPKQNRVSYFPRNRHKFNGYELNHIQLLLNGVDPEYRSSVLTQAALLSAFKYSNVGLLSAIIFRNVKVQGVFYVNYSVFCIDGYILDILHNRMFVPIPHFVQEFYIENEKVSVSKLTYVPTSRMCRFYFNDMQLEHLQSNDGITRHELFSLNANWRNLK